MSVSPNTLKEEQAQAKGEWHPNSNNSVIEVNSSYKKDSIATLTRLLDEFGRKIKSLKKKKKIRYFTRCESYGLNENIITSD